jgi:hypothetical protein
MRLTYRIDFAAEFAAAQWRLSPSTDIDVKYLNKHWLLNRKELRCSAM